MGVKELKVCVLCLFLRVSIEKNLCCYRLSLLLGVRLRIGKLSGGISRNSEGGGGGGGETEEPRDLGYS